MNTPDKVESLLESIIRITEERDRHSLERVLINTLAECIEHRSIILLNVGQDNAWLTESYSLPAEAAQTCFTLLTDTYGEQHVQPDQGLKQCLEQATVIREPVLARTLFPLLHDNRVSGILAIYGQPDSGNSELLINGFIRIYCNFIDVIHDSQYDTLTGLLNRKTFDSRISELIASVKPDTPANGQADRRHHTADKSHWLGILDIDHFKKINDTWGHIYGDEVLLLFSDLMKKVFRARDFLFRYGGEEFIVVLSPASESDAEAVFERFRQQLNQFSFPQVGHVTTSIGMVRISAREHPRVVIEHADKALYYAKEHGRNRTCNYHALVAQGQLQPRQHDDDIELF